MNRRFLLREIVYSRSQGLVFILCVALSLCSMVAINSLRRDVFQSIASDARGLHGGDVIVRSHYDLSPAIQNELDRILAREGIQYTRTWEFYSVTRREDGQGSLLSNIKAVEDNYPLYGTVELKSGRHIAQVLQSGKVIVSPLLLERLNLALGDRLLIGSSSLEIVDQVVGESMRPVDLFNFGPRIFVSAADLDQIDLVKKGSRVHLETLLKVAEKSTINTIAAGLKEKVSGEQERVATSLTAQSRVKRFFDNLLFFLALISVFTLLLAGIGMQSSLAALLRSKEKSFAILRSLGATSTFLLSHYLAIIFILSSIGCLLGIFSGLLLEKSFSWLLAGLLPAKIVIGASLFDVLEGVLMGAVVVSVFTFLPLSRIKNVKPNAVFRKELEGGDRGAGYFLLLGGAAIMFTSLVVVQLEDLRTGLYFIGGLVVFVALIYGILATLFWLLSTYKVRSLALRQAIRSMFRPGNATRTIAATLASALTLLLSIYLVEDNLHSAYIESYPIDAPNLFCLDIQKSQEDDFRQLVGSEVDVFAVIRARLVAINGQKIDRKAQAVKRGDRLSREFNLTYREKLLEDEVVVEGTSLFGDKKQPQKMVPVSVLDTVAEMGDMRLGDVLDFNIQGVPLQASVSSIRSRTKSMLYPFFYFVFPEKVLSAAPQTLFGAIKVKEAEISALENTIVNNFPNISTINVSEAATELGKIMQKLSRIINFFASFSILAGLLILVSSVLATRIARTKEAVYYKVLGADSRFVLRVFLFENLLLALLSSGAAILVAQLSSWAFCHFLFDIGYHPSWLVSFAFLAGAVLLVVVVGLLTSRSILLEKPIGFLREQI